MKRIKVWNKGGLYEKKEVVIFGKGVAYLSDARRKILYL
jgi:hypothetical protein